MKKLMEQMAEELSAAFEKSGYDPSYGKVTVSNRPDLCEFQCNGAMPAVNRMFSFDARPSWRVVGERHAAPGGALAVRTRCR